MPSRHRPPQQQLLPMELPLDPRPPPAPPTRQAVEMEARRMWATSPRLQQRHPTFERLLADPLAAKALLTCSRLSLLTRQHRRQTTR